MIPLDVAAALGAGLAVLLSGFVGWCLGALAGRRQSFADMDTEHLAAVLYRVDVPAGRPWLVVPEAVRAVFREQAARILDDLAGGPR